MAVHGGRDDHARTPAERLVQSADQLVGLRRLEADHHGLALVLDDGNGRVRGTRLQGCSALSVKRLIEGFSAVTGAPEHVSPCRVVGCERRHRGIGRRDADRERRGAAGGKSRAVSAHDIRTAERCFSTISGRLGTPRSRRSIA